MYTLKDMLYTKSIAVIGASNKPDKMGYVILKNIIDGGFEGDIYPVNTKETNILGLKCYPDISAIPGEVDLVVITIPAKNVKEVLSDAGEKGTKGAIVISGGFKEIGNDQMEKDILEVARKYGMRIIGPNCQGVNYTGNKLCATWPLIKAKGPIGIVSQSGTIGATIGLSAEKDGIGISCFSSLGNKSDIAETDFIDFFADDENTKVIAINIEGIQDGNVFVDTMCRVAKQKPIVVLKPGRTAKGIKAVASHTKSIAGNDVLFSAFCKKHGILRANDITQLYDFSKAVGTMKKPKGNKMLVMTSSGGAGIIATDTAEEHGIDIAPLNDSIREKLKEILPSQCVISNPLDLTGDSTSDRYEKALEVIIEDGYFDMLLVIFGDPIPGAYEAISNAVRKTDIPIMVSYLGGGEVEVEEVNMMNKNGIAVFPTPERAVRAASELFNLK